MDPFTILPQEKSRYIDQFNSLKPSGGIVSGDQAKGFTKKIRNPAINQKKEVLRKMSSCIPARERWEL